MRGSVRDGQGELLPSCGLEWIDETGRCTHVSAEAGTYALPGLRPGHFIVVLYGTDLRREEVDTDLAAEPALQQRDFTAHSQPDVVVRLKGSAGESSTFEAAGSRGKLRLAEGLTVRASLRALSAKLDSMPASTVEYSECGTFYGGTRPVGTELPADGIGLLRLSGSPPLFVGLYCGNVLLESRRLESIPREVVFDLDPERIRTQRAGVRARIVAAKDGAPIPAALVLLDLVPRKTDTEGRVEFANLIPGPHSFELMRTDGFTQLHEIELPAGEVLDLGDIAKRPEFRLNIRFAYPTDARPRVNFVLRKDGSRDPLEALRYDPCYASGSDDPTSMPFPGAGRFVLRVVSVDGPSPGSSAHLAALPLHATLGEQPGDALVVKLLPTTDVCVRPPRNAKHDSRWLISLSDGEPYRLVQVRGREPRSVELPQGSYTIACIDPETGKPVNGKTLDVGTDPSTVELQP